MHDASFFYTIHVLPYQILFELETAGCGAVMTRWHQVASRPARMRAMTVKKIQWRVNPCVVATAGKQGSE